MFTIYYDPVDHPGQYVARGFTVGRDGAIPDPMPAAVVCTLDVARQAVPLQHDFCLVRSPEDDPKIVESWI